jgi:hypothetical protein
MTVDPQTVERLGRIILERETQTRIACFLIGVKQANAAVLSRVEFQPMAWEPFALLHGQLCREIELIGLLQRVTDWSLNPAVYVHAAWSNARLLNDLQFVRFLAAPFAMDAGLYRYLGLAHALYAHLRFIPALPLEVALEHRFLAFLRTLEAIHGREMQAQIALLRKLPVPLSDMEKEDIAGREGKRVREVFQRFVRELTYRT